MPQRGERKMPISKVETGSHAGEYRIRVQPSDKLTGERIRVPVQYAKSKPKATAIERKLWAEFEAGYTYREADKVFAEAFRRYIEEQNELGRWEVGTYRDWQYSGEIFEKYFKKITIRKMNEELVRKFARKLVHDRNLSVGRDSVIAKRLTHMRSFFEPLVGESIKSNPVPVRALSKFFRKDEKSVKKKKYLLSEKERTALSGILEQRLSMSDVTKMVTTLGIWIGLETGMRPQEIQGLKWNNLKTSNGYHLFIIDDAWSERKHALNGHLKSRNKGDFRETLPLTHNLYNALLLYKKKQSKFLREKGIKNHNKFILLNLNDYRVANLGYPVSQASLNEMLIKLGTEAKINAPKEMQWSMYSLRHTVATKLGNTPGMSYPWAAARMGHTLEEFMQTYVHVDKDRSLEMLAKWV